MVRRTTSGSIRRTRSWPKLGLDYALRQLDKVTHERPCVAWIGQIESARLGCSERRRQRLQLGLQLEPLRLRIRRTLDDPAERGGGSSFDMHRAPVARGPCVPTVQVRTRPVLQAARQTIGLPADEGQPRHLAL